MAGVELAFRPGLFLPLPKEYSETVGSKTFDGVLFAAFSDDHPPPHVHGSYAGVQVIVEVGDGEVRLSGRRRAIKPSNAKQADVAYILWTAKKYAAELLELWRRARG